MTEKDWEEFKKNVIPLEKKINYLKKIMKKYAFQKKEHEEKFDDNFFI